MNAGIIGILLHQLPYQFSGLPVLSTIAFLVDFVLFICFSTILLARFIWFGQQAYQELTDDVSELSLLACWPIAWLTLSSLVCLIVSTAGWGGHSFTIVGYVMWWIGVAWMLVLLLFAFITIIRRQKGAADAGANLPPVILIPTMGVATVAVTGGLISSYSAGMSAGMAVPVIIVAFLIAGIGMFMATFLYTLVIYRLFASGWPDPMLTPTLFILIGPMAQSAGALQILGNAASTYQRFGGYQQGTFLTQMAAASLSAACILLALLMTGIAIVFALIAIYAMLERAYNRELTWSPTWNSIIFPTGTLTTSCLLLSIEMNSPAFRVVTAALVILLVLFFFVNLFFTIWKVAKGELLIVRDDPRQEKED